ncbi:MAG: tetratricopeptide repeat protein [Bacteroidales bacterium]|nr:tetratricopeptide repeat protein [Bacteroidales bacterium]
MAKQNYNQTEENLANIEEAVGRTEKFVENNKKNMSYGVLALFAVVILYMGYQKYVSKPAEEAAYNTIWEAEQLFGNDQFAAALNGNDDVVGFLSIIDEYGSTASGNLAQYYAGICYLNIAKNDSATATYNYEEAIDHLKSFDSEDINIKAMSIGAIGDCMMELGDKDGAAAKYVAAANYKDNDLLTPMFLKKAGMTYSLLGDHDKALELFNRIKTDYFKSGEYAEVKKYIAREEQFLGK